MKHWKDTLNTQPFVSDHLFINICKTITLAHFKLRRNQIHLASIISSMRSICPRRYKPCGIQKEGFPEDLVQLTPWLQTGIDEWNEWYSLWVILWYSLWVILPLCSLCLCINLRVHLDSLRRCSLREMKHQRRCLYHHWRKAKWTRWNTDIWCHIVVIRVKLCFADDWMWNAPVEDFPLYYVQWWPSGSFAYWELMGRGGP